MGRSAILGGLPLFLGGIGCLLSGFIARRITTATGSTSTTRRILACTGLTGACTLLALAPQFENVLYTMIAMGFASFCNDLVMPGAWGAAMDIGGKYAGTLSGTMNMMGNIGGALSSFMIGVILEHTHNWQILFYISAAVYFMGNFCWLALDSTTPLEKADCIFT
jgi:MFS family permease